METAIERTNLTKFNRIILMKDLLDNWDKDTKELKSKLSVCYNTIKKWKSKMEVLSKLRKVTIDRALKEMIFTNKIQVEVFEWLLEDLNYFSTFKEVSKRFPITRYYYKTVIDYIREEIKK